jgi:hypothetical protein
MHNRYQGILTASAGVVLLVGLSPVPAVGQTPASDAKKSTAAQTYTAQRTADGQPDLQGVWNFSTPTSLERPNSLGDKAAYSDAELAKLLKEVAPLAEGGAADRDTRPAKGSVADVTLAYNEFWSERGRPLQRTSLITDPADGKLPALTAEAKARVAARVNTRDRPAQGPEDRGLWERCLSRGEMPRIPGTYNNNVQIFQGPGYVVLHYEMIHENRIIPLDGRPHVGPEIRQWLGDSRGRWEGNTLVVDTTNFSDKTSFRESGAGLHLIERFTRNEANSIDYRFTVDDPTTFTKSWSAALPWNRVPGMVYEYACHEGNLGLQGILAGARADERAETDAAKKGSN